MRSRLPSRLLLLVVAVGCTSASLPDLPPLPQAPAGGPVSYRSQVEPILEGRCVVCHGCNDAPCQLLLSSSVGSMRTRSSHTAPVDGAYAAASLRVDLPRAAPLAPPPFVSGDATQVGERGRSRDTEFGHASDAVDHDEDGVGDMVFRTCDAAAAACRDHPHCPPAECVQRYGG